MTNRGCRGCPAAIHPHFLFGAPKRLRPQACAGGNRREAAALGRRLNGGGAVKRKNAFSPGSRAQSALPPGGTRLVTVLLSWGEPLRNHGRSAYQPPEPSAPCSTLPSSGKDRIDQLLFPRSPLRSALPGCLRPFAEKPHPLHHRVGGGLRPAPPPDCRKEQLRWFPRTSSAP